MKKLKKLSLVYTLQVMAVILLFGYAVASPENGSKTAPDGIVAPEYNKLPLIITDMDSVLTGNTNAFWNHTAKTP